MRRRVLLAALLVAGAAVLAHARGLSGGFVYDDHRFIVRNRAIESLEDPGRFFTDPGTAGAAQGVEPDVWRPLRTLAFAVDRALFGLAPFGWHLAGVALHAANAVLVWLLLLRLLGRSPARIDPGEAAARLRACTLGALVFALHPATVEAVAWVSSRGDLLAWFFVLLAFEALHRPGRLRTALGALLLALACLSKESAVIAFALLPLRDAALPADVRPPRATTWARTGLLAAVTAAYFVARQSVMPAAPDLPPLAQTDFPDGGRLAATRGMLASVLWYAKVLVWPFGFPFDRNVHTDPVPLSFGDPTVVAGAGILVSAVLAGVLAWRRARPAAGFGWLGALVAMIPVSSVLVPLKAFAAERFLYPALPCLVAVLAAFGVRAALRAPARRRRLAMAAGAALVAGLGLLAWHRTGPWRDDASLWAAVLREEPMNPRGWEGVGFEHLRHGRLSEAERALSTYREFQPLDGKAHAQRAALFLRLHQDLTGLDASAEGWEGVKAPRFVLAQAIAESRTAVEIWSRIGLARGRGDRALLRATLEGWRTAALEYGDLGEARRANDLLVADDASDGGAVAYGQRRVRAILALLVLEARVHDDVRRDVARRRVRAELLRDAGVDPGLSDAEVRDALLPSLSALLAERPSDHALRRHRVKALLRRAEQGPADRRAADLAMLESDLDVLVRAVPAEPGLAETLTAVQARRGPR